MGRSKQEYLDQWLMPNNPSPSPSPNGTLRFSLPISPGNDRAAFNRPQSSLSLNRSSLQPDFNPYYPANHIHHPLHNTTTNTTSGSNNSVFLNPNNYPDQSSYYDVFSGSKFSQLNLSSANHHRSPAANSSVGRFGSFTPGRDNNFSYVDPIPFGNEYVNVINGNNIIGSLQRIRGQNIGGLYVQPQGSGGFFTSSNDDVLNGYQELDNLPLRHPDHPWARRFQPELGYIFTNQNWSGRNGVIRERSFDTISSSSSSFDRNRKQPPSQQQQRQNFSSLEELRSKIFSSLEELRGKIFIVAKDQNGCRDLQKMLGEGKAEEKEMIFSELKNHVRELMVDQFANYLAQKMFEVCDEGQITELLLLVISDERDLMAICLDMHGTRAMQKLLGHLTTAEQRSLVISALRRISVTLTKSTNGHHVVEHCLKNFPNEDKTYILSVVADNCLDIATDKSGCCVLQQCVEHARGEPRDRLVSEIIANALVLSEHPYGNYVVQFLVGLRMHITSDILAQLAGNYVSLSMNKYGSNVVEKCMKETPEEQAMQIIQEIIGSQNFLTVCQDPFGNYVAQSAVSLAKGSIRHVLLNLIQMNYSYLHSHPHGKRVLARARGSRQRV